MRTKFMSWFGALFFLSVAVRCFFYLGLKLHTLGVATTMDWVVILPMGLVSSYLSYMFFKKLFPGDKLRQA